MEQQRVGAGERLARLETQMEGVKTALDRGTEGFTKLRESQDELKRLIVETHAACVKPEDLRQQVERIDRLETFRDRAKRYSGVIGTLAAGIIGALTLFGPTRVAEAWRQLWS